jgi:hypothetical protein
LLPLHGGRESLRLLRHIVKRQNRLRLHGTFAELRDVLYIVGELVLGSHHHAHKVLWSSRQLDAVKFGGFVQLAGGWRCMSRRL